MHRRARPGHLRTRREARHREEFSVSTSLPIDVFHVAIIGAGTMGTGIAMCLLNAGLPVTILEDRGVGAISKTYSTQFKKGR